VYSPIVLDHFHNPRNVGPLDGATHSGTAGSPGDGPHMIIELEVSDGMICGAAYQTYGCPAAVACGSIVAQIVQGRSVDTAAKITAEDVILLLGGLPEGKHHLAALCTSALTKALEGTN